MKLPMFLTRMVLAGVATVFCVSSGYADGDGVSTAQTGPVESAFTSPDQAFSNPALDTVNFLTTLGNAVAAAMDPLDAVAPAVPAVTSADPVPAASLAPASSGPVIAMPLPSADSTTVTTTTTGSGTVLDPTVTTTITTYIFNQGLSKTVTTDKRSTGFQSGPLQITFIGSEIKFEYFDRGILFDTFKTNIETKTTTEGYNKETVVTTIHENNSLGTKRVRTTAEKYKDPLSPDQLTLKQDTTDTNSFTPSGAGPVKRTGFIETITYYSGVTVGSTDKRITHNEDGSRVEMSTTHKTTKYFSSGAKQEDLDKTIIDTYDALGAMTNRNTITTSTLWRDVPVLTRAEKSFDYIWIDAAGVTLHINKTVRYDVEGKITKKSFLEQRTDASGAVIESVSATYSLDYTFTPPKLTVTMSASSLFNIPGTLGLPVGSDEYNLAVRRWIDGLVAD